MTYLKLSVVSLLLGASVFFFVQHQRTNEVDNSLAGIIARNSVTANPESSSTSCIGSKFKIVSIKGGWRCIND